MGQPGFFLNLLPELIAPSSIAPSNIANDLTHLAADQQGIPIPFRPVR
jgi:hypothetical protein